MRPAHEYDLEPVMRAAIHMLGMSPAPQMKFVDIMCVRRHIEQAIETGHAVVQGDYFILFDIGSPWYSTVNYLIEDLIIKFDNAHGTRVSEAIACLEEIAKSRGCVAVAAGDTQVGYMTPKYQAQGFRILGTQLFKEIPDGIHSQIDRRRSGEEGR